MTAILYPLNFGAVDALPVLTLAVIKAKENPPGVQRYIAAVTWYVDGQPHGHQVDGQYSTVLDPAEFGPDMTPEVAASTMKARERIAIGDTLRDLMLATIQAVIR